MDKPACFSTIRIYHKWLDAQRVTGSVFEKSHSVCRDCLPGYQLRMKKLGRCENPKQMFTFDEEGGVVGCGA